MVIYQSVPVNTVVEEGTTITVHFSSGPTDDDEPTDTVTDEPTPSPDIPPAPPEDDQPVFSGSSIVYVDLSDYTDPVQIRVEVGNDVQFDSTVDPVALGGSFTKTITGTGQQWVTIYIDNVARTPYLEDFSQ